MLSKITSKFQITIPKEIRAKLKLLSNDSIEWVIEDSKIYERNPSNDLLKLRSVVNLSRFI